MKWFLSLIFIVVELLYHFEYIVSVINQSKWRNRYSQRFETRICLKQNSNAESGESKKFKIITPNDIGKIFDTSGSDDNEDDEDILFDEDDDAFGVTLKKGDESDQETEPETEPEYSIVGVSQKESKVDLFELVPPKGSVSSTKETQIIGELEALFAMPGLSSISDSEKSNSTNDVVEEEVDEFAYYAQLDSRLDKSTFKKVKESMTVKVPKAPVDSVPRTFRYDPITKREDPMLYGAYRRWQVGGEGGAGSTDTKRKKGLGGKGKKNKNAADKFYDAIKKLGSGPAEKGSASQTGIAEPPPNSKPIQPKKPITKKNKKKIITPDDIDSLFKKTPPPPSDPSDSAFSSSSGGKNGKDRTATDEDDEDFMDEEDDDEEDEETIDNETNNLTISGSGSSSSGVISGNKNKISTFNSIIGTDDQVPQWLEKAEKDAKNKKKAAKNKKAKKITDDWRFWAAIIAGAGFASAFYSVYQQTGGLSTEIVFPFGVPSGGENAGEIVI